MPSDHISPIGLIPSFAPQSDSLTPVFIIKFTFGVWMSLAALIIAPNQHLSLVTTCWFNAILASKFSLYFFSKGKLSPSLILDNASFLKKMHGI